MALHPLRRAKKIYRAEARIEHRHNVHSRGEGIAAGLRSGPGPYDTASDAGSRKYNPLKSLVTISLPARQGTQLPRKKLPAKRFGQRLKRRPL